MSVLAGMSRVEALQSTKTYKVMQVTFQVTPTPVAFAPHAAQAQLAAAPVPFQPQPVLVASTDTLAWDVPPMFQLAQVSAQPSPVPVQFVTQADPNAQYLKIVYETAQPLPAGYGANSYSCPLEIFTYYTTAYTLADYGYGTSSGASGTYPIENYPTTSYLTFAPSPNPTFTPFSNDGTPGGTVWSGTAGQSITNCLNLNLTVPSTLAPGTYTASVQFNLNVSL